MLPLHIISLNKASKAISIPIISSRIPHSKNTHTPFLSSFSQRRRRERIDIIYSDVDVSTEGVVVMRVPPGVPNIWSPQIFMIIRPQRYLSLEYMTLSVILLVKQRVVLFHFKINWGVEKYVLLSFYMIFGTTPPKSILIPTLYLLLLSSS